MPDEICVICNQNEDNPYELGEKITSQGVTVHYFCVVRHAVINIGLHDI